jgi:phosphatidylinositol alpha-1,6-mannosyltransferase
MPRPDDRSVLFLGEEILPCPGGVAQWGASMARALARRGVRVVYAARGDFMRAPDYYGDDFAVHPIGAARWKQRKEVHIFRALVECRRLHRPRAVVALNCKVARVPLLLRPYGRWKVAVVAHGMEITKNGHRPRRQTGIRWTFGLADLSVAVSRFTRERILEAGVSPDQVRVLPCGVDPDRFRPRDRAAARARFGFGDRSVVLTLARLVSRKGHDLVIRALQEVRRSVPDVLYVIAGPESRRSGPRAGPGSRAGAGTYEDRLRALARQCGVGDAVRFLGYVEEETLPDLYAASDVYAMPSRHFLGDGNFEGFGISYLEANACGVPVIGADTGGVADAIVDGVTGWLIPPEDTAPLAARLAGLLADPAAARRMGEAGRERVLREFTWERVAGLFLDALESKTGPLGRGRPRVSATPAAGLGGGAGLR